MVNDYAVTIAIKHFEVGVAMSDDRPADEEHYREIAQKIREIARQTWISEADEELRELADRIERMAECLRASRARRPGGTATSKS